MSSKKKSSLSQDSISRQQLPLTSETTNTEITQCSQNDVSRGEIEFLLTGSIKALRDQLLEGVKNATLKATDFTAVKDFPKGPQWEFIASLYEDSQAILRLLAILLNAAFTSGKVVFLFSKKTFNDAIEADPNTDRGPLGGTEFKEVKAKLLQTGAIKEVIPSSGKGVSARAAAVVLSNPTVLMWLRNQIGLEQLQRQVKTFGSRYGGNNLERGGVLDRTKVIALIEKSTQVITQSITPMPVHVPMNETVSEIEDGTEHVTANTLAREGNPKHKSKPDLFKKHTRNNFTSPSGEEEDLTTGEYNEREVYRPFAEALSEAIEALCLHEFGEPGETDELTRMAERCILSVRAECKSAGRETLSSMQFNSLLSGDLYDDQPEYDHLLDEVREMLIRVYSGDYDCVPEDIN